MSLNPVLLVLIAAFAIPCGVALSNYTKGLYVYVVIVPFAYFLKRLLFLATPVTQTDWTIASALPDLVLICIACSWGCRRMTKFYRSPTILPVGLFLLWCLLEIANPAITPLIGFAGFKKTALYMVLYFVTSTAARRDPALLKKLANVTVACAIPVALYGISQFFFGMSSFENALIESGLTNLTSDSIEVLYAQGYLRAFSTLSGPWVFGDYLCIAVMFNLLGYLTGRYGKSRFILISCVLLSGLFVSLARSSYLMLLLSLGFFYVLQSRSKKDSLKRFGFTAAVILTLVIAAVTLPTALPAGLATAILAPENLYGRIDQWTDLTSQDATFSLVGSGLGSMQASYYFGQAVVAEAHSFLLSLELELGIIGLLLFLMIPFAECGSRLFGKEPRRSQAEPSGENIVLSLLLGMLLAKSVAGGLWGQYLHDNYLWLFFGVLTAGHRRFRRNEGFVGGYSTQVIGEHNEQTGLAVPN